MSGDTSAYLNTDTYIYPIGVQLKKSLSDYIETAINRGILSREEANLIAGYEIVRGDRTGNKSIIAKGLLYNMNYYIDVNPSTSVSEEVLYPNYPFNDLREDQYLNNQLSNDYSNTSFVVEVSGSTIYNSGDTISFGTWGNPYLTTFILDRTFTVTEDFTVSYQKIGDFGYYSMSVKFYGMID